jgi:predicted nuclease of predicted toxin-antitoxin system
MKFLIDAQLPRRLALRLQEAGFEALHTLDLPLGNRTPDRALCELSIREHYIVVSKDEDFVNSFYLQRIPSKLLLISTGNIDNFQLEALVLTHLAEIQAGFQKYDFLEIDRKALIFHS